MLSNKVLYASLLFLLVLDLGYTFLQQYALPLDGDLAPIVVPSEKYEAVMSSPFGWKAIRQDTAYAGVNRFFIHWGMYHYFRNAPLLLQWVASPIDSAYLSAAVLKTAFHAALLGLLVLYIGRFLSLPFRSWLLPAILVAPLLQSAGYYANLMAVVEGAPTYACFYAFPAILLLLYYYPAYLAFVRERPVSLGWGGRLGGFALAVVLPFTGPLAPGIVLVLSLLAGLHWGHRFFVKNEKETLAGFYRLLPAGYWASMAMLNLLCLYSLYVGTFNIEQNDALGLFGRYAKLPEGLFHQFTRKPGPSVLLLMVLANALLLHYKVKNEQARQALRILRWIGLFSLIYILLLPLGGYRDYRALIIRRDTILPILLALFYFWGLSATLLMLAGRSKWASFAMAPAVKRRWTSKIKNFSRLVETGHPSQIKKDPWPWYFGLAIAALLLFTLADEPNFDANACQRAAFEQLQKASSGVVRLSDDCLVLAWAPVNDPAYSRLPCTLLSIWGIVEEGRRFYQE
ncbi:MAG: hypothetical protein KDD10_15045 [Phaeodactylibacter sp.]|nr:hypothetical protein [Phaeodactylibacter sp.]MCB9293362.1 hypothetical protein [Lewinellaceae bacterium]